MVDVSERQTTRTRTVNSIRGERGVLFLVLPAEVSKRSRQRLGTYSIEWRLRTPLQSSEIRIFAFLGRAVRLVGLSLYPARFFVALLLLA